MKITDEMLALVPKVGDYVTWYDDCDGRNKYMSGVINRRRVHITDSIHLRMLTDDNEYSYNFIMASNLASRLGKPRNKAIMNCLLDKLPPLFNGDWNLWYSRMVTAKYKKLLDEDSDGYRLYLMEASFGKHWRDYIK